MGFGFFDIDAYLGHLNEEFNSMEAENAKISNEIEYLTRKYIEGGRIAILVLNILCTCIIVCVVADAVFVYLQILVNWRVSLKS